MTISDETLNAFIDGELSPLEMNIVRDAIASDENIAQQVEALMAITSQVHTSLSAIDALPLSAKLETLRQQLEDDSHTEQADNVVSFPWWHKARKAGFMPTAIAASVAAVFGFFMNFGANTGAGALPDWTAINQALSHQPSGEVIATANGTRFEGRLTFLNHEGEYCRQFYIKPKDSQALQSIACRRGETWSLHAAMPAGDQTSYQTASNDSALDAVIDAIIQGDLVTPEQEAKVIQRHWQR